MKLNKVLPLLLFTSGLFGIELEPWFFKSFEFEPKAAYTYSHYKNVDAAAGPTRFSSDDQFCNLSMGFTYFSATNVQIEFQTAQTRSRSFGPEYAAITGRKLIWDDVSGEDPLSVALGLTLNFPWEQALRDVSCFHHSRFDPEFTVSIGKEIACGPYWSWHFYGVGGFGCGVQGSPWLRSILGVEKNFYDTHNLYLKIEYLKGCGENSLITPTSFIGYKNIAHQSFDLTAGYKYTLCSWGTLGVDYKERFVSVNCPINVRAVTLSLLFPFFL